MLLENAIVVSLIRDVTNRCCEAVGRRCEMLSENDLELPRINVSNYVREREDRLYAVLSGTPIASLCLNGYLLELLGSLIS